MTTASFDLCRELYELSGWDDTVFSHYVGIQHELPNAKESSTVFLSSVAGTHKKYPAYDLGYLLRKLPDNKYLEYEGEYWLASWSHAELAHDIYSDMADTPEDAACKLCIELIRQEVLKP